MAVLKRSLEPPAFIEGLPAPTNIAFTGGSLFITTLRERIDLYFAGRQRCGDPRLYRKTAIIVAWFAGSYIALLMSGNMALQILLCISYALAAAALGFNVFHDATHGSFSPNAEVNGAVSRLTCATLGMGRYLWRYKHNILHHRYTNIFEWDDDIETRGSLRLSPHQPWQPRFKNQHRWFYFLYCAASLEWLFVKDFVQYFTLRMNPYKRIPAMSSREKSEFWVCKAFYFIAFVFLPFAVMPMGRAIAGLLLFHVVLSLTLTFVFNLAHGSGKADFPELGENASTMGTEWAAHQMHTTANFAPSNRILNWYSGGLNFQIEHHLFPNISHTHYSEISSIVRSTAHEFGLPYHQHATYLDTIKSHFRILRDLGMNPSLEVATKA